MLWFPFWNILQRRRFNVCHWTKIVFNKDHICSYINHDITTCWFYYINRFELSWISKCTYQTNIYITCSTQSTCQTNICITYSNNYTSWYFYVAFVGDFFKPKMEEWKLTRHLLEYLSLKSSHYWMDYHNRIATY